MMFKKRLCWGLLWFLAAAMHAAIAADGFVAGTLVKVPGGYAAIETLKVGDRVCCCDKDGSIVARHVTATMRCRPVKTCMVMRLVDNAELRASPHQKFFVRDVEHRHKDAWMKAGTLSPKQLLLSVLKSAQYKIKDVWRVELPAGDADHPVEFYDLSIDSGNNYLVTKSDLIAHNFNLLEAIASIGLLAKGVAKIVEGVVYVGEKAVLLFADVLSKILKHTGPIPLVCLAVASGGVSIQFQAVAAILKTLLTGAIVAAVESTKPGSTQGFYVKVDDQWYQVVGEHVGHGNAWAGNVDSRGNRLYTPEEQWRLAQECQERERQRQVEENRRQAEACVQRAELARQADRTVHAATKCTAQIPQPPPAPTLSFDKQKLLQKMDAEAAEFNRTLCTKPLYANLYSYNNQTGLDPGVVDAWKQRRSVLELTAQNAVRQQLATTLPADARGLADVQQRIKPLPYKQYDLFLSRDPAFVAFLKAHNFQISDFTIAGASPTQALTCFEVEGLLHELYEQQKFSHLSGHHNPDLPVICAIARTALEKNKFYQPGKTPVGFSLVDFGKAIARQRTLHRDPEIHMPRRETKDPISQVIAGTATQFLQGAKAIVQSPKALGHIAVDAGLLAFPLTTNIGLMKMVYDLHKNRVAINDQLSRLNDSLRNDPIHGLSQVSALALGACVMHKAVGSTQSLLCEARHMLCGIGAGLQEELLAASRVPHYAPQGSILEMVETIEGTWTLASKYGSAVVGEGIRNLEVAAQVGKLTTAPPINQLATTIKHSFNAASAIKALPCKKSIADNVIMNIPACTTWLDVGSAIKNFAGSVDSTNLTKLAPDKIEFVAQSDSSKWIISATPPGSAIKPATNKFIVQAELQQFDSRQQKFVTVRRGQMEVAHNHGFSEFAQDMANTFGVPRVKAPPAVSSHAPDGAAAALAEIKKGPVVGQKPIFVGNAGVPEVSSVAVTPVSTVAQKSVFPVVKKHPSGGHVFDLLVPQGLTLKGKIAFIANEFELGIKKMAIDNKDFNFTSNIELSATEAETVALKIIDDEMTKKPNFELKQADEYRVEAVLVEHENGVVKTTTLRYRYPQTKKSGSQKGVEAGNVEYEVKYVGGSVNGPVNKVLKTNLHLLTS